MPPLVYWDEESGLWLEDGGEEGWDAASPRESVQMAPTTPPHLPLPQFPPITPTVTHKIPVVLIPSMPTNFNPARHPPH